MAALIGRAVIIPTGDEIANGVVCDTNSPAIAGILRRHFNDCRVTVQPPVRDDRAALAAALHAAVRPNIDLAVFIGGSGGGAAFDPALAPDLTHAVLANELEEYELRDLMGSNGHLWARLLAGRLGATLVVNVPGPYDEALAAAEAICTTLADAANAPLTEIVAASAAAVRAQYPIDD